MAHTRIEMEAMAAQIRTAAALERIAEVLERIFDEAVSKAVGDRDGAIRTRSA